MKALLIGATGATGKDLLQVLIQDSDYLEIVTFVRRATGFNHPKLKEVVTDFDNLETVAQHITGDVLFSCLGTTLKLAGSKENQRHIDLEIPFQFAEMAKRSGISKIVLLSAYGASITSKVFYSRIKGELEEKISDLEFKSFIIFRPGLLLREKTDRVEEKISASILKLANRLGLFQSFRPMTTRMLAEKLAVSPKVLESGKNTIELDRIFQFGLY